MNELERFRELTADFDAPTLRALNNIVLLIKAKKGKPRGKLAQAYKRIAALEAKLAEAEAEKHKWHQKYHALMQEGGPNDRPTTAE